MRRAAVFLAFAVAAGCGKKPPAPAPGAGPPAADAPAAPEPPERDQYLATLKTKRGEAQLKAADKLAQLAEADPAVIDGLVELLRDKTNAGPKQALPTRVGSTREA